QRRVVLCQPTSEVSLPLESASGAAECFRESRRRRFASAYRAENGLDRQECQIARHPVLSKGNMVHQVEADFAMQPPAHPPGAELAEIIVELNGAISLFPKAGPVREIIIDPPDLAFRSRQGTLLDIEPIVGASQNPQVMPTRHLPHPIPAVC